MPECMQTIRHIITASAANKAAGKQLRRQLPARARIMTRLKSLVLLALIFITFWVRDFMASQ
jgi:hypothetical protein